MFELREKVREIGNFLIGKYVWHMNDFDSSKISEVHLFRYLVACITVAGEAEDRTFAATSILFEKYPDVYDFSVANVDDIHSILKNGGIEYGKRKSKFIKEAAIQIRAKHNGRLPDTRKQLEALSGVGRHIASVLLATLHNQHEFAVDFHVRRIFRRMGFLEKGTDRKYEEFIAQYIPSENWGHLSRSFVDFGQDICIYQPRCQLCPFSWCPSRKENKVIIEEEINIPRQAFEVIYVKSSKGDKNYAITIRGGKLSCTCPAGKYRKTCKHIEQIKDTISLEQG